MFRLTRKRLACYFLTAAILAALLGVGFVHATGDYSYALWPCSFILLGIVLLFDFPPAGIETRSISTTPGMPQLLAWGGLIFVLMTAFALFDWLELGHPWGVPLKPYHFIFYSSLLIVMLAGVWRIEKRYPRLGEPSDPEKNAPPRQTSPGRDG